MSRPQRTTTSGTFLVTSIAAQRRRIFQVHTAASLFLETLQHYRVQGLFKLHAFVVMPDHIHLLITTPDLPKAMKHVRGGFSHRLAAQYETWQRGYDARPIVDEDAFLSARQYILQNPVRARLCIAAEEYPFSSGFRACS